MSGENVLRTEVPSSPGHTRFRREFASPLGENPG